MDFLTSPLRRPLEHLVSEYLGRAWSAQSVRDLNDLASHPGAILSDRVTAVFVKFRAAPDRLRQLELECGALRSLPQRAAVRTPLALGVLAAEPGGALLLLQPRECALNGPALATPSAARLL